MDIWKQVAIEELQKYDSMINAVEFMKEEVADINAQLTSATVKMDGISVQGNSTEQEDRYSSALIKKDKLKQQIQLTERSCNRINKAMDKLTRQEQKTLTYAYIRRGPHYVEKLMEELFVERSQVYRLVDKSLKHYIAVRYGE